MRWVGNWLRSVVRYLTGAMEEGAQPGAPDFEVLMFPDLTMFSLDNVRRRLFDFISSEIEAANERNRLLYEMAVQDWRLNVLRCLEVGIPAPPKPLPPLRIHVVWGLDGWPVTKEGPDSVAPPAEDIDLPRPVEDIEVGDPLGNGWYQAIVGENSPAGTTTKKDGKLLVKVTTIFGSKWREIHEQ